MRLIFITLLLVLSTLLCAAQTNPPKDVPGWQDARWGMTADELQKAFGAQLVKRPKRDSYVGNTDEVIAYVDYFVPLELAGKQFKASLKMDIKTDKLSGINVQTAEDEKYASTAEVIFEDLEKALGQKYGAPAHIDDKKGLKSYTRTRRWVFPTTTIELRLLVGFYNIVQINYEPTLSKDANKL